MTRGDGHKASAELRRLVDAVIDGTATGDEVRQLDERLQANADARRYYRDVTEVHSALRWMHRADQAPEGDAPSLPLERTDAPGRSGAVRRRVWPPSAAARRWAGAAVMGGLLAAIGAARFYRDSVQRREVQATATIPVAELHSDRGCRWGGAGPSLAAGAELHAGQRLELAEGTAKLMFNRGAAVVLEGPAEVELISATSLRLVAGTLAVRVSGPDKEFVVVSPDASIVDLGTSFGVYCGPQGATEVEVFEGAVEVFPEGAKRGGQVLGVGASARVRQGAAGGGIDRTASSTDHFGNLLELLWDDMASSAEGADEQGEEGVIQADFGAGPVPGAVDTFYGAAPGRGWLTPWMAAGNPIGDLAGPAPLSGEKDPYLGVRFFRSYERSIARQYGARTGFDPSQPHIISWRWRFEGNIDHFRDQFQDRISFYGNPFFRRNSWPTNSWLVGVVSGDEIAGKKRRMLPMRWFAFDGRPGDAGKEFERRNMVDTGMELKPGVVYRFAVVVYPQEAKYDVAIRDDSQTFTRTGLSFRDPQAAEANVLHFSVTASDPEDDLSIAVDSIRIEPLRDKDVQQQVGIVDSQSLTLTGQ